MLALLKGLTQGAPIFGSPDVFLQTLQGGGMLGPMLIEYGIEPVKIKYPDELKKSLSVESKVFSIYAEGHVRAGKRETHVRLTAVVDFRKAPSVQDLANQVTAADPAAGGQPSQSSPGSGGTSGTDEPMGIQGALVPSTAGRVIYYRVN